jgi:hypothetical protein
MHKEFFFTREFLENNRVDYVEVSDSFYFSSS